MSLPRALLSLFGWFAVIWAALIAATLPRWPLEARDAPVQLHVQGDSSMATGIFLNTIEETGYELARRCPLAPKKRLVLLGGSGARAYRPQYFEHVTAADEVLLLSMNFSNFSQLRQIADDLLACLDRSTAEQTAVVIIPTAYSFTTTQTRFDGPYTIYEVEKRRNRLFAGPPGQVRPIVPRALAPLAVELWRPVLLGRYVVQRISARIHAQFKPAMTAERRDAHQQWEDEAMRAELPRLLPLPVAGEPYAPEQAGELRRLIEDLQQAHVHVVLAQQPTQQWLREFSPAYPATQQVLRDVAAEYRVPYIDQSGTGADAEFDGPLHALRTAEPLWAARLAEALKQLQH
ncbi:MAG TPA: hypothetical protein VHE37_11660, partial [Nevskiaceae bacterium]|nr:hypothetical protein [Nevskiaceae bacterium]